MIKGLVSYSHVDTTILLSLKKHLDELERQGLARFWTDRAMAGGEEWSARLDAEFVRAEVILLLISPDALSAGSYVRNVELPAAEFLMKAGRTVVWPLAGREVPMGRGFPWSLEILPEKPPQGWLASHRDLDHWSVAVAKRIAHEISQGRVPSRTHDPEVSRRLQHADRVIDDVEGVLVEKIGLLATMRLAAALRAALRAPVIDFLDDVDVAWTLFQREVGDQAGQELVEAIEAVTRAARLAGYAGPSSPASRRPLAGSDAAAGLRDVLSKKVDRADDDLQLLKQQRRGEDRTAEVDGLIEGAASITDRKLDLVKGLIEADDVDVLGVANTAGDMERIALGFAAAVGAVLEPEDVGIRDCARDLRDSTSDLARSAEVYAEALARAEGDDSGSPAASAGSDELDLERQALELILSNQPIPASLAQRTTSLRFHLSRRPGFLAQWEQFADASRTFSNLELLSSFAALRFLSLANTAAGDLRPITSLTELGVLSLQGTPVREIEPLRRLKKLERLNLSQTRVTDISALSELSQLRGLEFDAGVRGAQIDLSPLSDLARLENVQLNGWRRLDVAPLGRISSLRMLGVGSATVSNLESVGDLARLEGLFLQAIGVPDERLALGPGNVLNLYLSPPPVSLGWIGGLQRLRSLDVQGAPISNIAPLAKLRALSHLYLGGTNVTNIDALAALTNLEVLDLSGLRVEDLTPIAGLPKLRRLLLSNSSVRDLSPLRRMAQLESLNITGLDVEDLQPVAHVRSIVGPAEGASRHP